jgi:hypothetical protein
MTTSGGLDARREPARDFVGQSEFETLAFSGLYIPARGSGGHQASSLPATLYLGRSSPVFHLFL